jgi:hypothetical protein
LALAPVGFDWVYLAGLGASPGSLSSANRGLAPGG